MKISCTRENLHQGLSIASHLASKNVNLPILQNVLVKAEGGAIRFTTTNLEIAVNCSIRGKVDEPGEYTIPSKLFFDYVSLLPNETVTIETDGEAIHLSCGQHKTKINGLPSSEFPLVPNVQCTRSYKIPVEDFKRAIGQVLFAVSTNESNPKFTGVCMKFVKGSGAGGMGGESRLIMAATDTYRLAEVSLPLISEIQEEHKTIVPSRTLSEVNRIISVFKDNVDSPSFVELKMSDNQLVFSYGSVELVSRIIEGEYPDYTQIIPKTFRTEALLDRTDLIQAVKAASLFSRQGLFDVNLSFDPTLKRLSANAVDAARGENTAPCAADITGDANTVTINFRYLLDGLNAMSSEKITFKMIDSGNACLLVPQSETNYTYLIMPIRQ
jgi:DNA polymerase-3 subunit beta